MDNKLTRQEIAKKLGIDLSSIKRVKQYSGSSPASICEIILGEKKERAILKENTTKTEWIIYKTFSKYKELPLPKVLATSDRIEMPWILIRKVPRGIHPIKWKKTEFEKAIKTLAIVHAKFYDKPIEEELFDIRQITKDNWKETLVSLLERIEKATNIARMQKSSFPLTLEDIETIKELISEPNFPKRFFSVGQTLVHGDAWSYNFFISKAGTYLVDWQESKITSPAWEMLYFFDYSRIFVNGLKISLKPPQLTLEEITGLYLDELKSRGVTINSSDFEKALSAAAAFQIAYHWTKRVKPYAFYLRGGRYFINTVLRLFPDRKTVQRHFQELIEIATK
ncbi:MAG: phosphotransferase [Candidatus Heimdallarchaeaceae archaeon]